jgi:hypothetical protein
MLTIENGGNQTSTQRQPLFALGKVVALLAAFNTINELRISASELIFRHATGDWADLCERDQEANVISIHSGARVFSSYFLDAKAKIWIITEADRSSTTIMLPHEY